MKKILLGLFLAAGLLSLSSVSHAANYELPETNEAISYMQNRAEKQGYKLPVVRKFLVDAYRNDKYTAQEKKYLASLIREVEGISEQYFRTSPWYEVKNNGTVARLYGQIDDTIELKTVQLLQDHPNLKTVELVYVPGSHHDENNHKAWRILRAMWINTLIKRFGFVASGGTDLLMAGKERVIKDWAQIWVHAWTSPTNPESWTLSTTHSAHNEYVSYFQDMWIDTNLYRWTLQNTRPESIHWLTQQELTNYWF